MPDPVKILRRTHRELDHAADELKVFDEKGHAEISDLDDEILPLIERAEGIADG